jgi:hypothetical protein
LFVCLFFFWLWSLHPAWECTWVLFFCYSTFGAINVVTWGYDSVFMTSIKLCITQNQPLLVSSLLLVIWRSGSHKYNTSESISRHHGTDSDIIPFVFIALIVCRSVVRHDQSNHKSRLPETASFFCFLSFYFFPPFSFCWGVQEHQIKKAPCAVVVASLPVREPQS